MIDGLLGGGLILSFTRWTEIEWTYLLIDSIFLSQTKAEKNLLVMGFHSRTLVMQLVVFCRSSGSEESWQSEQTSGAVDPGPADPDNPEPPHGGGPVPAAPDEHLQPPGAGGGASAHVGEPQAPDELPSRSVRWNVWSLLI